MNRPVGRHCLKALLAITVLVLWLPLSGCSPAAPTSAVSNSNSERPEPPGSEQAGDRSKPALSHPTSDVIIVGAGISGLSAALDLGRAGANVTVSPNMIGGRRIEGDLLRASVVGPVDALVKAAARYTVESISGHEADLEDVFLAFYSEANDAAS